MGRDSVISRVSDSLAHAIVQKEEKESREQQLKVAVFKERGKKTSLPSMRE